MTLTHALGCSPIPRWNLDTGVTPFSVPLVAHYLIDGLQRLGARTDTGRLLVADAQQAYCVRTATSETPAVTTGWNIHVCDSWWQLDSEKQRYAPSLSTSATTVFAPDMLFPLSALAVSYGALNRLSHCSFNRTFPGLRELATWHPLPGWNGARPPILKLSMGLSRTIDVNCASLGCVSERITDRQQQRASSTVSSLGPPLTVGCLLIGKARLYQSADDFNLSFRSGVCDCASDAGQCCAERSTPLFHDC